MTRSLYLGGLNSLRVSLRSLLSLNFINSDCVILPLCKGDQLPKTGCVVHCDVGEDLPVQFNACGFEPVYKSAVRESVQSGGGVNSGDPESSKIAFACAAMRVGVVPTLLHRLHSGTLEVVPPAAVTFGMLEHPTAPFASDISRFYSCHLNKTPIASGIAVHDHFHYFAHGSFGHPFLLMNEVY